MQQRGSSEPVFAEGVTDLQDLGSNRRQGKPLRLMVNEGEEMTNRQYREMFDITARTALRYPERLVEAGQVPQVRQGRSVRYVAG